VGILILVLINPQYVVFLEFLEVFVRYAGCPAIKWTSSPRSTLLIQMDSYEWASPGGCYQSSIEPNEPVLLDRALNESDCCVMSATLVAIWP
jgi:hypothetical protein